MASIWQTMFSAYGMYFLNTLHSYLPTCFSLLQRCMWYQHEPIIIYQYLSYSSNLSAQSSFTDYLVTNKDTTRSIQVLHHGPFPQSGRVFFSKTCLVFKSFWKHPSALHKALGHVWTSCQQKRTDNFCHRAEQLLPGGLLIPEQLLNFN